MTLAVEPTRLEQVRALIVQRLGLDFDNSRRDTLSAILLARLEATGLELDAYILRLSRFETAGEEWRRIAAAATVSETYFFRNIEQFQALTDVLLKRRQRGQASPSALRILSAGCASGDEAYSLAISLCEHGLRSSAQDVELLAVDASPAALERARQARYSAWSLRETPEAARMRWFSRSGQSFVLDDRIRATVTFEERNLTADDPTFWRPRAFDAVFCRNVIMYFSPEKARELIKRIANSLQPGGFLFLGHAETLRGLSHDFHLCQSHGAFYYQRKENSERSNEQTPHASTETARDCTNDETSPWVGTICRATERVRTLTRIPTESSPNASAPPRVTDRIVADRNRTRVVEMMRSERFAEALALIKGLPAEVAGQPQFLLLQAVLLAHDGRRGESAKVCEELLHIEELNAGAHYLMALCHEDAGDRRSAAKHDQLAVYLDPTFAMPHLHLGLLARQDNDRARARQEFRTAIDLFHREDASRILLFGGGFGRDALIALCRNEVAASGGSA